MTRGLNGYLVVLFEDDGGVSNDDLVSALIGDHEETGW